MRDSKAFIAVGVVVSSLVAGGCGGDEKRPPASSPPTPSTAETPNPTASASASPAASNAPDASTTAAPPAPPKGSFQAFARATNFDKVDKVGKGDGAFKPDGVKDLVFDVEFEGPATAFIVVSTDGEGLPNGEFNADTFVGGEHLPREMGANLNEGKYTAGVGVYEGDKLLNAKDGSIAALAEGRHKLTFYVSSKDAPKTGPFKAIAVFADKSIASSTVAAAPPAPAPAAKKK